MPHLGLAHCCDSVECLTRSRLAMVGRQRAPVANRPGSLAVVYLSGFCVQGERRFICSVSWFAKTERQF